MDAVGIWDAQDSSMARQTDAVDVEELDKEGKLKSMDTDATWAELDSSMVGHTDDVGAEEPSEVHW